MYADALFHTGRGLLRSRAPGSFRTGSVLTCTMETRTAQIKLSEHAQEAVGGWVAPGAFPTSLRVMFVAGMLTFIAGLLLMPAYLPLSQFMVELFLLFLLEMVFFLAVGVLQFIFDPTPHSIRYAVDRPLTWFVQASILRLTTVWGLALVLTLIGAHSLFWVVTGIISNDGDLLRAVPRLAWVLSITMSVLAWFAWRNAVRASREPEGIQITPDRVIFSHEHADVHLRWNQLTSVGVGRAPKPRGRKGQPVPCVRIESDKGRVFTFEVGQLGSDPNVVASFILHHRDHPETRQWLSDPEDAIRRFRAAQKPAAPRV